ncbi:MAG: hypothetical protein PVH03_07705 [Chloroflexota bacterium]
MGLLVSDGLGSSIVAVEVKPGELLWPASCAVASGVTARVVELAGLVELSPG